MKRGQCYYEVILSVLVLRPVLVVLRITLVQIKKHCSVVSKRSAKLWPQCDTELLPCINSALSDIPGRLFCDVKGVTVICSSSVKASSGSGTTLTPLLVCISTHLKTSSSRWSEWPVVLLFGFILWFWKRDFKMYCVFILIFNICHGCSAVSCVFWSSNKINQCFSTQI